MVLAGRDVEGGELEALRLRLMKAKLSLVVDGEPLVERKPVRLFLDEPEALAAKRPMKLDAMCLFRATDNGAVDGAVVGYFLPRGTVVEVEIEDMPELPEGVVMKVVGVGSHYEPELLKEAR